MTTYSFKIGCAGLLVNLILIGLFWLYLFPMYIRWAVQ